MDPEKADNSNEANTDLALAKPGIQNSSLFRRVSHEERDRERIKAYKYAI